jgi:copper chaperone NosL
MTMPTRSRVLLALAAVLLVPVYWLPLWSIRIVAPQYREGLGMYIGVRDIWGHAEHDIQNINILNHYIGMKPIDPAIVDVLRIMPWAVAGVAVLALVAALVGRRWAVWGWLATFAGLGTAGLLEFRAWNHDYGTNLDPTAPIKIPGMTYEPPMLGVEQLLNMTTSSWPSWGTLFVALAFTAGVAALWIARRRPEARPIPSPVLRPLAAAAVLALVAAGCGADAVRTADAAVPEFAPDLPPCAYCEGTIPESRFGGQVTTADGTVFRFMSVECLAAFLLEERVPEGEIRAIQVVDYNRGEALIDAASARYLRSQFLDSPNGLGLLATETEKVAANLHYFFGGERIGWDEVLATVRDAWKLGAEGG